MKKRLLFLFIYLLLYTTAFCQTKHTFSLGSGTTHLYNGMLAPYNWNGSKIIGITYGNERLLNKDWKSFLNVGAGFSRLRLDYDFANKRKNNQPFAREIDFFVNTSFLMKIATIEHFTTHIGGIISAQGNYQVAEYRMVPTSHFHAMDFLQIGVSGGLSASLQLKLKNITIRNTISYLMLGALLYPNYTGDSPFYNGTKSYITLVGINNRNFVENTFGVEFPLYINGKFINSFSIFHDLRYEKSTVKDNIFRRLEHTFNVGIILKIDKLNINSF